VCADWPLVQFAVRLGFHDAQREARDFPVIFVQGPRKRVNEDTASCLAVGAVHNPHLPVARDENLPPLVIKLSSHGLERGSTRSDPCTLTRGPSPTAF
jgi:hypothetical protein